MVIQEARCCGGTGWQAYNTVFHQQVANDLKPDWLKLNSSLYAVTFHPPEWEREDLSTLS